MGSTEGEQTRGGWRGNRKDGAEETERTTTTSVGGAEDAATIPDRRSDGHSAWDESGGHCSVEGYTPFQDLQSTTAAMSTGPAGGVFYADISSFRYEVEEEDGDSDDGDDGSPHEYGHLSNVEDTLDFRAVADSALSALEDEYGLTLQQGGNAGSHRSSEATADVVEEEESLNLPPIRLPSEDFGPDFFVADFDDEAIFTSEDPPKQLPNIDSDAVRRAVESIHLRDPKLRSNLAEWEALQLERLVTAPRLHPIISSTPLKAFRTNTDRAIRATANLSRSATIAEGLRKLDLLRSQERFRIDVVGCDHVECGSEDRIRQLFGPIVRWIGAYSESPKDLTICLSGPNLPSNVPRVLDLTDDMGRLNSARVVCSSTVYEECCFNSNEQEDIARNLIVSFNAGMWGYREWRPTLQHLAVQRKNIPLIVTAYTLQEAEDDADVIREELASAWGGADSARAACLWGPELNPLASKEERRTATAAPGRRYRENAAWQGWRI